MTEVTDKQYPIQKIWLLKKALQSCIAFAFIMFFVWGYFYLSTLSALDYSSSDLDPAVLSQVSTYVIMFFVFLFVLSIITLVLRRVFFHYAIEDKFLVSDQGILSKQKKYLPYARIQHIITKRDLFDKLFGLTSVMVEDASQGGAVQNANYAMMGGLAGLAARKRMQRQVEIIGSQGNKMGIPGLKLEDALKVQKLILDHVLHHLNQADSGSGL